MYLVTFFQVPRDPIGKDKGLFLNSFVNLAFWKTEEVRLISLNVTKSCDLRPKSKNKSLRSSTKNFCFPVKGAGGAAKGWDDTESGCQGEWDITPRQMSLHVHTNSQLCNNPHSNTKAFRFSFRFKRSFRKRIMLCRTLKSYRKSK